jgi:hypothetical protein
MDHATHTCPEIPTALIRYLENVFPDRAVDPSKADPSVVFGNAEVIRHLRAVQKRQEEGED